MGTSWEYPGARAPRAQFRAFLSGHQPGQHWQDGSVQRSMRRGNLYKAWCHLGETAGSPGDVHAHV